MGRLRRNYEPGSIYFVTCRTSQGLPFVPNVFLHKLILGLIARAHSKYSGITICHFLFMSNHYHFLVKLDGPPEQMCFFFGYLNGQLSKYFKRLLGVAQIKFWSKRYDARRILTAEDVIAKIAYCYLNPVTAGLVDRTNEWEGPTSLSYYTSNSQFCCEWIPITKLTELPRGPFSANLIEACLRIFSDPAVQTLELDLQPNAWKEAFPESRNWNNAEIRTRIMEGIRKNETLLRKARIQRGKRVLGVRKLRHMSIFQRYYSQTFKRSSLCISSCKIRFAEYKAKYDSFCAKCQIVYNAWKAGDISAPFPEGAFIPSFICPRPG